MLEVIRDVLKIQTYNNQDGFRCYSRETVQALVSTALRGKTNSVLFELITIIVDKKL